MTSFSIRFFLAGCLIVSASFWTSISQASFLSEADVSASTKGTSKDAYFIAPNETRPDQASEILKNAPEGVYISVGTERGFIGASLSNKTTHLLLMDNEPTAVFYNRINIALLTASQDLQDFKRLRSTALHSEWLQRSEDSKWLSADQRETLRNENNFVLWRLLITEDNFKSLHEPSRFSDFFQAKYNYHVNDDLFRKLQDMARAGRIAALNIDLKKQQKYFSRIVEHLGVMGLKISVLDLSNAWYPAYIGISESFSLARRASKIASSTSVLLFVGENGALGWSYAGFTFEFLRSRANLNALWTLVSRLSKGHLIPAKIPNEYANQLDADLSGELVLPEVASAPFEINGPVDDVVELDVTPSSQQKKRTSWWRRFFGNKMLTSCQRLLSTQ